MKTPSTELTLFSWLEHKTHQKQFTDDDDEVEAHHGSGSYHQQAFSQVEWADLDNVQYLTLPEAHNLIIQQQSRKVDDDMLQ